MNNNDKVLEIAERVLLLESQISALKEFILSQPNAPSLERLDRKLFDLQSQIANRPTVRELSDEFRLAVQAQDSDLILLQSLHDFVLRRVTVS